MPRGGKRPGAGRKRKPTAKKKLEGTYRKDRAPKNEPKFEGAVAPPDWLDGRAKKEWRRLAPQLIENELLTPADQTAFAIYCDAVSNFERLTIYIAKKGRTIKTGYGGSKTAPEVEQKMKYWQIIKDCSSRFGLEPSSRAGMNVPAKEKPGEKNSSEDFLFGPPKLVSNG